MVTRRFTILRGITLHVAARYAIHLRLPYGHRKAGKRYLLSGFPVSATVERRIVRA